MEKKLQFLWKRLRWIKRAKPTLKIIFQDEEENFDVIALMWRPVNKAFSTSICNVIMKVSKLK